MIGFDIGGTKCAVTVGKISEGKPVILGKRVFPTDHTVSPEEMIERLCGAAEEMTDDFSAVGISCGGPLDAEKGIIQSPPNLPGWDDVHIKEIIRKRWNSSVVLQNDANACALAEWMFGAGMGTRNMVFLTFGSGLGAGLILDGKLYEGTNGNAGEVGHLRLSEYGPVGYGKSGSFEGFCSGNGIAELARLRATEAFQMGKKVSYCASREDLPNITTKSLSVFADRGEEDAKEIFAECGRWLGRGLALIVDILNPEAIVIGSVFTRSSELIAPAMEETLRREALPASCKVVKILPAKLSENIGDMAALTCAAIAQKGEGK